MLMGRVVVTDDMNLFFRRNIAANQIEEANPFLVAVFVHVCSNDFAAYRIHRGEQRCGAITLVIMGHCLTSTLLERKPGLSPVQGLNLAFLIAGENECVLR